MQILAWIQSAVTIQFAWYDLKLIFLAYSSFHFDLFYFFHFSTIFFRFISIAFFKEDIIEVQMLNIIGTLTCHNNLRVLINYKWLGGWMIFFCIIVRKPLTQFERLFSCVYKWGGESRLSLISWSKEFYSHSSYI